MGQKGTKQQNLRDSEELEFLRKTKRPEYGNAKIVQNKSGQTFLQKQMTISSIKQMYDAMNKVQAMQDLEHQNLAKLIKYECTDNQMFCANFSNVILIFEHYENNLLSEVLKRWERLHRYDDEELLEIMKAIILPLEYLHSQNIAHGDLRGFNILIDDSQEEEIKKLSCVSSCFQEQSQYIQFMTLQRPKLCTLAPEQLDQLKIKTRDPKYNAVKADIFQAGFCILQTAALTSCASVYNWRRFKINEQNLELYFKKISKFYCQALIDIIKELMIIDPKQRPCLSSIKEKLLDPELPSKFLKTSTNKKTSKKRSNILKSDMNKVKTLFPQTNNCKTKEFKIPSPRQSTGSKQSTQTNTTDVTSFLQPKEQISSNYGYQPQKNEKVNSRNQFPVKSTQENFPRFQQTYNYIIPYQIFNDQKYRPEAYSHIIIQQAQVKDQDKQGQQNLSYMSQQKSRSQKDQPFTSQLKNNDVIKKKITGFRQYSHQKIPGKSMMQKFQSFTSSLKSHKNTNRPYSTDKFQPQPRFKKQKNPLYLRSKKTTQISKERKMQQMKFKSIDFENMPSYKGLIQSAQTYISPKHHTGKKKLGEKSKENNEAFLHTNNQKKFVQMKPKQYNILNFNHMQNIKENVYCAQQSKGPKNKKENSILKRRNTNQQKPDMFKDYVNQIYSQQYNIKAT